MTIIVEWVGPFQPKPGVFRSSVMTRWWWGYLAVAVLHIGHREYAEQHFDWSWPTPKHPHAGPIDRRSWLDKGRP